MTEIIEKKPEFKEPTKEDWNEFFKVNNFYRSKHGKPLIDMETIINLHRINQNPELYDTRLPDELAGRTDGKVSVVYPFNQKETEIMDEEEFDEKFTNNSRFRKQIVEEKTEPTVEEITDEKPLTIEYKKE